MFAVKVRNLLFKLEPLETVFLAGHCILQHILLSIKEEEL